MSMPPPPPPPGHEPFEAQSSKPQPYLRGTLILVLGILSFFICGIILGIVAFVMGNNAIKEIDRNPGAYSNRESSMPDESAVRSAPPSASACC